MAWSERGGSGGCGMSWAGLESRYSCGTQWRCRRGQLNSNTGMPACLCSSPRDGLVAATRLLVVAGTTALYQAGVQPDGAVEMREGVERRGATD